MNTFTIIILLVLGLILFLILVNRNAKPHHQSGFYDSLNDSSYQDGHSYSPSHHEGKAQSEGDWSGRDMSHDHHDFGHDSTSSDGGDSGGDTGGDAGGGDGGGGGGGE